MKSFASKTDLWLGALLVACISACSLTALYCLSLGGITNGTVALLLLTTGAILPAWILCGTRYCVSENTLLIVSGPCRWLIPLAEIHSITETRNPLSSPALSLDRLLIAYGSGRSVIVSPADKTGFIEAVGVDMAQ